MTKIHTLYLKNLSIYEQLQIEEALLRIDHRNWCIINIGSPPAIVLGISNRIEDLIDHDQLEKNSISLIRRFSGGGTVVVDEDTLFISFIGNKSLLKNGCFPGDVMNWVTEIYQKVFPSPAFACRENDYTLNNRKFGGNAQSITKDRWIQHSSFLYKFDSERMNILKLPKRRPKYRDSRNHYDFLCTLEEYQLSPQHVSVQIKHLLSERFHCVESNLNNVRKILEKPHRQATRIEKTSATKVPVSA
ncbi:MAG: lipoate--protein ligase [Waddliaceae bacterium]|nr:lipoate--protein ligase [Waddliaceae bacterium]